MAATNGNLVLCVEDELYRSYLEQAFAGAGTPCTSVAAENLAQTIAESPTGILLLQSDTAEQNLIELSSRLKRLFGDEIRVLLLSADYLTGEEAGASVDAFLQYPIGFDELRGPSRLCATPAGASCSSTTPSWSTTTLCRRCASRAIRFSRGSTAKKDWPARGSASLT